MYVHYIISHLTEFLELRQYLTFHYEITTEIEILH